MPYKSEDKSKLVSHLKREHGANQVTRFPKVKFLNITLQGMDYLMAGCTMSKEERIAIQVFNPLHQSRDLHSSFGHFRMWSVEDSPS